MSKLYYMREYLLLFLIATTGLLGLVSIHQDVKIQSQEPLILYRQLPTHFGAQPHSASIESSQRLDIFRGESWSEIHFNIQDYKKDEAFQIDFGNGKRMPLDQADTSIQYEKPGIYFVKLFKDNQLLEANEVELSRPKISL